MIIELDMFTSRLLLRLLPKGERLSPPALVSESNEFHGHERLFDFYGIPLDSLKDFPRVGITEFPTKDGPLSIDWGTRTIISPQNYHFSQNHKKVL